MTKLSTKAVKNEYVTKITRKCGYKPNDPSFKVMAKEFNKLRVMTLIILNNHMKGR